MVDVEGVGVHLLMKEFGADELAIKTVGNDVVRLRRSKETDTNLAPVTTMTTTCCDTSFSDVHPRYGYSPPQRGGQYSRRPPRDPHTLDYPASLKQFADWFRFVYPQQAAEEDSADTAAEQEAGDGSDPRNGIRSRWRKYKKEYSAQQLQTMFDHHKKSPWFWEKYDPTPDFQKLRTRVRKEGWKGRVHAFLHDLESGKFDPEVNETEPEQPPSPTKENATNGDISVMDTGEDNKANPDEDIQCNMDGDEEENTRAESR
ncbi:hypothetical protein MPER_10835, partial [Moniliophthora perniciosa FA553]